MMKNFEEFMNEAVSNTYKVNFNEQLKNINESVIRGDGQVNKCKEGNTEVTVIEDIGAKYLFIMYDGNSGEMDILATHNIVEYFVDMYGMRDSDANKIGNLKVGQSYVDQSNAIYVRLK